MITQRMAIAFDSLPGGIIRRADIAAGTLALTSMISFPRSFAAIKVVLIGAFIAISLMRSFDITKRRLDVRILPVATYYLIVAMLGLVWTQIGLSNGGYAAAAADYLRLYVGWSAAFFLLLVGLQQYDANLMLHKSIIYSGIIIAGVNALGMYDFYYGAGIFPGWVLDELSMRVGFHEGYTQVTSHNIGSLLFVSGYLIAWYCRTERRPELSSLAYFSLIVTLAIVVGSGRRALWLAILLTPITIAVLSIATGTVRNTRNIGKIIVFLVVAVALLILFSPLDLTIDFIRSAFSAEDERTIQSSYLLEGFRTFPLFGSGFGVTAGYLRSITAPWLYELTYHQMLFNFGLVGCAIIIATAAIYLRMAVRNISTGPAVGQGGFELLVGFLTFLIGTYSNPYLGSFDFCLILAILPLLASGKHEGPGHG